MTCIRLVSINISQLERSVARTVFTLLTLNASTQTVGTGQASRYNCHFVSGELDNSRSKNVPHPLPTNTPLNVRPLAACMTACSRRESALLSCSSTPTPSAGGKNILQTPPRVLRCMRIFFPGALSARISIPRAESPMSRNVPARPDPPLHMGISKI